MLDDGYINRISFPFISSTGDLSIVSEAVDDIVIWAPVSSVLPFSVRADILNGHLILKFTDKISNTQLTAYDDSGYILDESKGVCGIIAWNNAGVVSLRATLQGNDPQPYFDLYVHPSLCVPRKTIPLSTIMVNGEVMSGDNIKLSVDKETGLVVDTTDSTHSLSMYAKEQLSQTGVLRHIEIRNSADPSIDGGGSADITYDAEGDVWLKSEPTCDMRIITGDVITITEIANDKL